MGDKDIISLGISIIITCLVVFPIFLLIGILTSEFLVTSFPAYDTVRSMTVYTIIICILTLGLYIPFFILYLIGASTNKPILIKVGFGLGLPSWLLNCITLILVNLINQGAIDIFNICIIISFIFTDFPQLFFIYKLPIFPPWLTIFAILNIFSVIFCLISGSIVLHRIKYFIIEKKEIKPRIPGMLHTYKSSNIFSFIITSLIIIPLVTFTGLLSSGILDNYNFRLVSGNLMNAGLFALFSSAISLALYVPSSLTCLYGTRANNSNSIGAGFGLGLPSWFVSFFTVVFALIYIPSIAELQKYLYIVAFIYDKPELKGFFSSLGYLINTVPLYVSNFTILNILSSILCIIFGSFVLGRIRYIGPSIEEQVVPTIPTVEEQVVPTIPTVEKQVTPTIPSKPILPKLKIATGNVAIKRGGEIQGGRYIFKIKVENNTNFNITNLNFQIISYPEDSIRLVGDKFREISKLVAGGFVSPTFEFEPTKDCIAGTIHSSINYIDQLNNPHTEIVETHNISIVCGLLQPKQIDIGEFMKVCQELLDYEKAGEEIKIPYNSRLVFEKLKVLLPDQNFLLVLKPASKIIGDTFFGEINGFAEGKFNKKCVGLKITITGKTDQNSSIGMIEGFAQDQSMLPSLISELSDKITHWNCRQCKGPLTREDVEKLLKNEVIECIYCGNVITKLLG